MIENILQLLKKPNFLIAFVVAIALGIYNYFYGSKILSMLFFSIILIFVAINFYKTNSHK